MKKNAKVILDTINRDPKDNFLLDLIDFSKADYLVTGDKDLIFHNSFKGQILLRLRNLKNLFSVIDNLLFRYVFP